MEPGNATNFSQHDSTFVPQPTDSDDIRDNFDVENYLMSFNTSRVQDVKRDAQFSESEDLDPENTHFPRPCKACQHKEIKVLSPT
jgi:hypothetical protein